jgi:DNA-binding CsgD family transcriptional regulator
VLRPQFLQAYRKTEVWALLLRAEEAGGRGVILLSLDGRVKYMSTLAGDLMSQYLPNQRRHRDGLPAPLARWVRQQEHLLATAEGAPPPPEPLGVERDHRKLMVRLFPGVVQRLLLLEERVTSAALRALESSGLTRREAEVLRWLTEGKTNEEIATILGFSRRTAEKHVEHIIRKLGVENRTAAARALAGV